MAQTTFSGPVKSQRGFVTAGPDAVVNITAETTLTFAAHAGKVKVVSAVMFTIESGPAVTNPL